MLVLPVDVSIMLATLWNIACFSTYGEFIHVEHMRRFVSDHPIIYLSNHIVCRFQILFYLSLASIFSLFCFTFIFRVFCSAFFFLFSMSITASGGGSARCKWSFTGLSKNFRDDPTFLASDSICEIGFYLDLQHFVTMQRNEEIASV